MDTKSFLVIVREVKGEGYDSYTGLIVEAKTKEAAAADALQTWIVDYNETGYVVQVTDLSRSHHAVFAINPHFGNVQSFDSHDYSLDRILRDADISTILTPEREYMRF